MEHHPITFEQLADWLDGRLDAGARQEVEAHLAAGCPDCQADLNWLRRFTAAVRAPELAAPPAHLVRQVKAQFHPQPAPRRSTLHWSWQWAAMATTLLIIVMGVSLAFITRLPSLVARQARLAVTDGKVERKGIGSAWQAAQDGATLRERDHLRVTEGQAWLTLFDGSLLELQPGSEIALASLRSSLWGAAQQIAITQDSGVVRYEVYKLRSERSSFRVQSPVAQISVQGTHFWVTILDKQQTEVAVLEGQVSVTGALDSVSLAPQEAVIALADAPLRRALFPTRTAAPDEPTPTLDIAERTRTATRTATTPALSATPTSTGARTPSATAAPATAIAPATATASTTAAASTTATEAASPTQTHTSTATGSIVAWTPTGTPSATMTLTATGAPSASATPTATLIPSGSATAANTATRTPTLWPTNTALPSASHTPTEPPATTSTPLPSATYTAIPTDTPRPTWTSAPTGAPSATFTVTDTPIPSQTNTPTNTPLPTWTQTATATATATRTPQSRTITLQQGIDGYSGCRDVEISIWEPDTAHEGGTNDQIEIRTNDNVAALLRFDLSSIPANATVASAVLSLYVYDRFGTRAMTVGAYEVYRSWVAAEVTWNQAVSGQRWVAAGCNGIGSDRSGDAAASVTMNATRTWYDLPITGLAQKWAGSPAANFGLVLKAWGDPAGYTIVTSEHGGAWMRLKLTISYLLPN